MPTIPGTNFTNEQLCADINIDKNQLKDLDSNRVNEYGTVCYKNRQYDKALAWYIKSAIEDNAFAESNIGELYHKGLGVPENHLCALKWYLKSAKSNQCKSCFKNIGKLFESGYGIPLDKYKAQEWYRHYTKNSFFASIRGGTSASNKLRLDGYHLSEEAKNKSLKQLIKETESILEKEKKKLEEIGHKTGEKLEALEQLKVTYKLTSGKKKAWEDVPRLIPEQKQQNPADGSTVVYEDERINLKIRIRDLEKEKVNIETRIKHYKTLEKEKIKLERHIKEKDSKIRLLENEIDVHNSDKRTLRGHIKQKDTKIDSLNDDIKEWNVKTDQLKLQVKEKDKKINSVQTSNQSLKREKDILEHQLKEKDKRIACLENEKTTYHTLTIKQGQKIDTLKHEKENLEQLLKSKEQALVILNGEYKNLSAANQAINILLGAQKNQLNETELLKQNVERQLVNAKRKNQALEQENKRAVHDNSQNDIYYDTEYGDEGSDDESEYRYYHR